MSFLRGFVLLMAVAAVWCQDCTDNTPDNELTCPELVGLGSGVCDQDFIKRDNYCMRSCGRSPCPAVDLSSEGSVTLIGKVTGEKQDAGPPPASTETAPSDALAPPPPPAPVPTPPAEVPEIAAGEPGDDATETAETPVEVVEETEEVAEEVTEEATEPTAADVVVEEGPALSGEPAEQVTEEVVEETPEVTEEVVEEVPEVTEEVAEETPEVTEEVVEEVPEVTEEVVEETPEVTEEVAEEVPEVTEEAEAPVDCKPVMDLIAGEGELSFLKSALDSAGLSGTLGGFGGVIFAPTNAAFETLLSLLELSKDSFFSGNSQVIEQLLKIHVIPGAALTLDELNNGQTLTPLLGDAQKVTVKEGGAIMSPAGPTARVAKSLNEGCSAVVHIIDNVIIPKPVESVSD